MKHAWIYYLLVVIIILLPYSIKSFSETPVVGHVTVDSMPAVTVDTALLATSAKQDSLLSAIGSPLQAGGHVIVDTAPTTAVTGTFWPATQPVSGTFWQATQPVSLSSLPSLVAGTAVIGHVINDAGSAVIGHVIVDTAPTTAVTGTFWQATQPISIASMPSTPVTGTFWQATQPVSVSAAIATNADSSANGTAPTKGLMAEGVYNSAAPTPTPGNTEPLQIDSNSNLKVNVQVMPTTAVTGTFWQATQPVSGTFWQATQPVSLASLPALVAGTAVIGHVINDAGSAVIGHVIVDTAPTTAVTGTFWQATQPVSLASLPSLVAGSAVIGHVINDAGSAVIGHVIVDTAPTTAVTGTFWQATQPISGTVTANAGTGTMAVSISGSNPCTYPGATLVSITGATSGTAAVQIIALSGTTKIYICSLTVIGVSGTTPTFSLVQGTGTNCATSQTKVVQAFTSTANQLFQFATPVAVGVAGNELCYLSTGTTPIQNYQITYVQQ